MPPRRSRARTIETARSLWALMSSDNANEASVAKEKLAALIEIEGITRAELGTMPYGKHIDPPFPAGAAPDDSLFAWTPPRQGQTHHDTSWTDEFFRRATSPDPFAQDAPGADHDEDSINWWNKSSWTDTTGRSGGGFQQRPVSPRAAADSFWKSQENPYQDSDLSRRQKYGPLGQLYSPVAGMVNTYATKDRTTDPPIVHMVGGGWARGVPDAGLDALDDDALYMVRQQLVTAGYVVSFSDGLIARNDGGDRARWHRVNVRDLRSLYAKPSHLVVPIVEAMLQAGETQ